MRRMGRKRAWILAIIICVALAALAAGIAEPYIRAASLIARAAALDGWLVRVAEWRTQPFREETTTIPTRDGPVRARVYRPLATIDGAVLLTPGVHAVGIDELRLVRFARELASTGLTVVTPELPDLLRYEITPRSTDMIEDAARWLLERRDLSPRGTVGLAGVSFAGGLSIVAAGRPAIRDRIAFVFSLGGHGDLPRVLHFLCTGELPDGTRRPPHDYGVVVMLLGVADRMVPAEEVQSLREAVLTFLRASHLALVDARRAEAEFQRARDLTAQLAEPAATLMRLVNERSVAALGPRLLPYVNNLGADPALSPERSPAPAAPVYLLHGMDDSVIPAQESALLARHLEDQGTRVRILLSGAITHAAIDRRQLADEMWRLIRFWAAMLRT